MARKQKRKKKKHAGDSWWSRINSELRRRIALRGMIVLLTMSTVVAAGWAISSLEDRVERRLEGDFSKSTLSLVNVPESLAGIADEQVHETLRPLLLRPWLEEGLCQTMAQEVASVGWVRRVKHVRRFPGAVFEVDCHYRIPFAMAHSRGEYYLIDREGIRLPGVYERHDGWMVIEGLSAPAPEVGAGWFGEDVTAGLTMVSLLRDQPFISQIRAVQVLNFDGRQNPHQTHIELLTDRPGGRVRWGSAPGQELEENSVEQKLTILRRLYEDTGRVDASNTVIDISVYPDRYIVGQ